MTGLPRLDRSLTLSIFGPLARFAGSARQGIPILMYHSVSREGEPGVHPYYRLSTTPRVFESHMAFLEERGYQVIGLEDAFARLRAGRAAGSAVATRTAVITFDDGFLDFYTEAYPILAKRGYAATVFLPTAYIGKKEGFVEGKRFLSWPQVRELSVQNISFGSHSVSHGKLAAMEAGEVTEELKRSKESIEGEIGRAVGTFSYPYAFPEHRKAFTTFLRSTLEEVGYSCAVTTCIGTALPDANAYFLRRLPVNDEDDAALLEDKLAGGYNWLHAMQYASKSLKGLLAPPC
jgi:peptidoglycan/xylan/chitin deacetylase (PgdA/CDA1 family)